ncbi:PREDICTED: leucine-rich repeat-containing protein 37A-like [Elephantulus edwardii]|uniref:leucine-rich repeat-containing protein 37A-like n=1 Tax=Elephantulus edwardii TaxID=28737 RepID=UPI0003F0BA95|nr:PREDICTED: leucine-rich repeat-containing protein 37A-like [Elephantulus edwardii]
MAKDEQAVAKVPRKGMRCEGSRVRSGCAPRQRGPRALRPPFMQEVPFGWRRAGFGLLLTHQDERDRVSIPLRRVRTSRPRSTPPSGALPSPSPQSFARWQHRQDRWALSGNQKLPPPKFPSAMLLPTKLLSPLRSFDTTTGSLGQRRGLRVEPKLWRQGLQQFLPNDEAEPSPVHLGGTNQPTKLPEEMEPSLDKQEAPCQHLVPPTVVTTQNTTKHEVSHPGQNQLHPSNLPTVTVKPADMQLILTPEPTTEVQSFPTQHKGPAHPPETSEEVKPPTQQEDLSKLSELLEDNEPSPFQVVTQSPVYNEVTVHSTDQDQAQNSNLPDVIVRPTDLGLTITPQFTSTEQSTALQKTTPPTKHIHLGGINRPEKLPEEMEPSLDQQEAPLQPLVPPTVVTTQNTTNHEVPPPGQNQLHPSNLPTVTVKPADMQLILTPEPTTEVQSLPIQHKAPTHPPQTSEEVKPPTQQDDLSKLSELLEDNEPSPFQVEVPVHHPE